MKYYELIVECGHVGIGRSLEVTRYFEADSVLSAFESAKNMPRSKKKASSVKQVMEITYSEYLLGKLTEKQNNYLNTFS